MLLFTGFSMLVIMIGQSSTLEMWNFWKFPQVYQFENRGERENVRDSWKYIYGRAVAIFLGYPPSCQQEGVLPEYFCTLSISCWWLGGRTQSGCGANSWIVTCCIFNDPIEKNFIETNNQLLKEKLNVVGKNIVTQPLQRRMDTWGDANEKCGISNDRVLQKRIIGGKRAVFGQFPWQAYIKILKHQCGGVLVSRRFVATAAHCVFSAKISDLIIYLGELDTQDTGTIEELAPAELHRVKTRWIHPKFSYKTTQPDRYDLALLELLNETGLSFHITPICLPDSTISLNGREGIVAGWGKTDPSSHQTGTNVLRSVSVPILDISECQAWHKIRQINVELHPEMLCAGHKFGKQDACMGDSGGPLITLENGRWTLVGITSAGFGCGEPHQPGIYHKIPISVDWIRSVISKNL
ncbi:hypothetical protein ABEB36_008492 [Hypothenemus hampei]|uniref:Peptidase S1 domain-containing protein n=1 Tax=Hypothenemus hampei TaxID=57062 RepID=A0ABD1EM64_HYPHA